MRQERRSHDTRNKILEVAEQEFAIAGFDGAHLQGIAEQVGVQKTALYYYFPSKAAIYAAVLSRILEELDRTVTVATEASGTPRERLERLLNDLNDLLAERRNYAKILIRIFSDRAPIHYRAIGETVERLIGRVLIFYRSGVEAGAFRHLSARHFFQSIFGTVFFHYAAQNFGAAILGVDDIFSSGAVAWRRREVRDLVLYGVLTDREDVDEDSPE